MWTAACASAEEPERAAVRPCRAGVPGACVRAWCRCRERGRFCEASRFAPTGSILSAPSTRARKCLPAPGPRAARNRGGQMCRVGCRLLLNVCVVVIDASMRWEEGERVTACARTRREAIGHRGTLGSSKRVVKFCHETPCEVGYSRGARACADKYFFRGPHDRNFPLAAVAQTTHPPTQAPTIYGTTVSVYGRSGPGRVTQRLILRYYVDPARGKRPSKPQ